ncbi:conserved hypothetical protein [delta proteobacterium NaphS2]|nr:conserved hypothetical protein [delta proteobacterium NaphS2]
MNEKSQTPQMSMTNTKKEMLEAYEAVKGLLKTREQELLDAEKSRKELEKKAALAAADAQAAQDPVQRIHALRSAVGRELSTLAERLEEEIGAYRKISLAVEEKQAELKTIYGVETAATDLAALIEAQQTRKKDFEENMAARKTDFDAEVGEARAAWQKEKSAHAQDVKEETEALKKQRQREREEFEYGFARDKEQKTNALGDELNALQKEIAQKRSDFERGMSEQEALLHAREKSVSEREKEIASLEKEVEGFQKKLDDAVKKAVGETTERLKSDFQKHEALLKATFDGEKNVLASRIETLERMVKAQESQIGALSQKQEQAYQKVQEIANRAVDASKREIVIPANYPSPGSRRNEHQDT